MEFISLKNIHLKGDIDMRQNGILMHITSLPSPYGIGTMGRAAREFIDFLQEAGQCCWQILPICPTSYGDSPYQSFSTFAGNPYFIDLDDLAEDGLLKPEEYQQIDWGDGTAVDYALLYKNRFPVLNIACDRLWETDAQAVHDFCWNQGQWIQDYALFMALKEHFGGGAWTTWPENVQRREPEILRQMEETLADQIRFWKGTQYLFFAQWRQLKDYANQQNISIIGDVPIYVAGDSVDVWSNPSLFDLDETLQPMKVAGCPPDGFTADGQLWGNPLFHWDNMRADGYKWWITRIGYQCAIYDMLRIDHFRGFDAYYAIPFGDETARDGQWCGGPGSALFHAIEQAIGKQNIIAEDLGFLTASVHEMLRESGFPGMKVLQFAFGSRDGGGYLPHSYPEHCVAYIGTHDNTTVSGWVAEAPEAEVATAKDYFNLTKSEGYNWGMMRGLWASSANLTVVQMQDILGLGAESRMNIPSTLGGNWKWRAKPNAYGKKLADKLRYKMEIYCRLPVVLETQSTVEPLDN